MIKIERKIAGQAVAKEEAREVTGRSASVVLKRPDVLYGATYKIKPPTQDHAIYVTINDFVDEEGGKHPFELFMVTKDPAHAEWMLALSLTATGVFRNGGDVGFLIHEWKSVYNPKGGYFKAGGVYMPSVVAEIGHVLERHLVKIGATEGKAPPSAPFPESAKLCAKCNVKAVVISEGCATCLNCGDSKCG